MKKRLPALLLAICMLILPGCARGDSPLFPGFDRGGETQPQHQPQAEEQAKDNFRNSLGISQSMMEDMVVSDVQDYGDETIVRYAQTYRGVEIYGSSLMSSSADEEFVAGTYYDLSEAFDDTFDTQVAHISQFPNWMTDSQVVTFYRDTYRPVIYITDDNTAHLAVCFHAQVTDGETSERLEFVISHDGTRVFLVGAVNQTFGFTDASVTTGFGSMTLSEDQGKYYAYNRENNVYVAADIFAGDKAQREATAERYLEAEDGATYYTPLFNEDLIYSSSSQDWSSGERDTVTQLLNTYCSINQWYGNRFGYWSLDGKGGVNILGIMPEQDGSPAINFSTVIIWAQPNAVTYPEIMAHEFFHAVFARTLNILGSQNQTAALNEGLADTFGALYLLTNLNSGVPDSAYDRLGLEDCWILAKGLGDDAKNIPATNYTMDDYLMDRYVDHSKEYVSGDDWENITNPGFWLYGLDLILDAYSSRPGKDGMSGTAIRVKNSSTAESHHNAYIISHTMYQIWSKAFDCDADALSQVLYRTIRYLPSDADFADFREAFLYTMRLSYPPEKVAAAQGCFSNAGIEQPEKGNIVYIEKQTAGSSEVSMLDMASMTYGELKGLTWDQFFTIEIEENTWSVQGYIGECYYIFHFDGTAPDTEGAIPWLIIGKDLRPSGRKLNIDGNIRCGMTYAEVDAIMDLPPLQVHQMGWGAAYYPPGFAIGLHFDGDENSGILYSAEITPYG